MRTRNASSVLRHTTVALLAFGAALLWGAQAAALTPAPDLPPGTFHELRITSHTTLTVAQQITQPSICGNPNTCLHNEIRLGVSINFDTGVIAIDGRTPEDENGVPVLPGLPGAILFNTLSGPVEMSYAPPCENPDGCVGGEALYIGTIDQGGNISFGSMGFDFNLFGVSPISRFRGPVGTGPSTDPADPGVIAQGEPLNFATGQFHIAGIDFIPAPIVGTTLQLNRVRGTINPIPIPPVAGDDLRACQSAIQKAGAKFSAVKQKAVQACVNALLACEVAAETGGAVPGCLAEAQEDCVSAEVKAIRAEEAASRRIVRGCSKIGPANMVAIEKGLGMSLVKAQCDALGISMATREDIALCLSKALACSNESILARLEPRAAEVLAVNGYADLVEPDGCVPVLAPGNATGFDGGDVLACQTSIGKRSATYAKIKQKELQACMEANLECHIESEFTMPPGQLDQGCLDKAALRCERAEKKIASANTKRIAGIQRGCGAVDAANIPAIKQGLGFVNLTDLCQELDPPVGLATLDDLIACTGESIDCSIEGMARTQVPRGHDVLHHHGLEEFVDDNPCLHPECGDGLLDTGEECDPVFDPDQLCNADCTLVECGDGLQQGSEECDDGNTDDNDSAAGDGCNSNCQSNETCGNGFVDTIRGEKCDDGAVNFVATLDGAQETPPVVTGASGSATLTLNPNDTLTYNVTSTGLTATMAHIHFGPVGVPGPIVFNLAGGPTSWAGTTAALNSEQLAQLKAGHFYFNVHTAANITGEIRGQILFGPTAGGDGCSADCRSNETCGNGVIDAVTSEICDDGNILNGDGCDSTCQAEACSFGNGPALGTRTFSFAPSPASAVFNSIVGLGTPVGPIGAVSGPFSLTAGPTDATGSAPVTLDSDVIVTFDISLGGAVQCLKFLAAGTTGSLNCCGGHAVGISNTRDSNTGGLPPTGGQNNGPQIPLSGIGSGGIGDLLMAFRVQESGGATGFNCLTATYGAVRTEFWTTGTATGRALRPQQGGPMHEFSATGQPFECSAWTTENGNGTFVSADTAFNAIAGVFDAANVRKLDD